MKSVTVRQLKNNTGNVLRRVGKGEEVLVTKRGKPCAVIFPLGEEQLGPAEVRPYPGA